MIILWVNLATVSDQLFNLDAVVKVFLHVIHISNHLTLSKDYLEWVNLIQSLKAFRVKAEVSQRIRNSVSTLQHRNPA